MPPLRLAAIGLLLVLIDIRLGAFSLSLDLLGWLMVAGGLHRLAGLSGAMEWARNLAVAALVIDLLAMFAVSSPMAMLTSIAARLVTAVFVFCLATGLLQRLNPKDAAYRVGLQVLRVGVPLLGVAAAALPLAGLIDGRTAWLLYTVQLIATLALAGVLWLLGSRYAFSG